MEQVVLKSERLQLRRLSVEDEEFLFRVFNDPRVNCSYVCDSLREKEKLHNWLNSLDKIPYIWLVQYQDHPVGVFNCFVARDDSSTLEIGYMIDPEYWNWGFATEILTCLLDYLWKTTDYHKLQAGHFLSNPASGRVMQKAGMQYEEIRHDVLLFRGNYESVAYYYQIRK